MNLAPLLIAYREEGFDLPATDWSDRAAEVARRPWVDALRIMPWAEPREVGGIFELAEDELGALRERTERVPEEDVTETWTEVVRLREGRFWAFPEGPAYEQHPLHPAFSFDLHLSVFEPVARERGFELSTATLVLDDDLEVAEKVQVARPCKEMTGDACRPDRCEPISCRGKCVLIYAETEHDGIKLQCFCRR